MVKCWNVSPFVCFNIIYFYTDTISNSQKSCKYIEQPFPLNHLRISCCPDTWVNIFYKQGHSLIWQYNNKKPYININKLLPPNPQTPFKFCQFSSNILYSKNSQFRATCCICLSHLLHLPQAPTLTLRTLTLWRTEGQLNLGVCWDQIQLVHLWQEDSEAVDALLCSLHLTIRWGMISICCKGWCPLWPLA